MAIKSSNARQSDTPDDYDDAAKPSEVSAFKRGLGAINLEILRERLAGSISKKWKRDLVEAEFNRRMEGADTETADAVAADSYQGTRNWGRWTAGAIIGGCCLIILYAIYEFVLG